MKYHFKRLGENNMNTKIDRESFVSDFVCDTVTMVNSIKVTTKE